MKFDADTTANVTDMFEPTASRACRRVLASRLANWRRIRWLWSGARVPKGVTTTRARAVVTPRRLAKASATPTTAAQGCRSCAHLQTRSQSASPSQGRSGKAAGGRPQGQRPWTDARCPREVGRSSTSPTLSRGGPRPADGRHRPRLTGPLPTPRPGRLRNSLWATRETAPFNTT